jgi:DNA-binding MarR family transcriptional regulator
MLAVHAALSRRLDGELRSAHGLSLTMYDVLVNLEQVPSRRLTDLATALHFSQSGVSKVVGRMEAAGWLHRDPDPSDRRASLVGLTPAGRDLLRDARATHLAGVRRHFLSCLSPQEAAVLGDAFARVLARQHLPD